MSRSDVEERRERATFVRSDPRARRSKIGKGFAQKRGHERPVALEDAAGWNRRRSRGHEFVAGRHDAHGRQRVRRDGIETEHRDERLHGGVDPRAARNDDVAATPIFSATRRVQPRTHASTERDRFAVGREFGLFDLQHRVRVGRERCAGHDLDRRARAQRSARFTGGDPPRDRERNRRGGVRGPDRPTVHHGFVERGKVERSRQVLRDAPSRAIRERHESRPPPRRSVRREGGEGFVFRHHASRGTVPRDASSTSMNAETLKTALPRPGSP